MIEDDFDRACMLEDFGIPVMLPDNNTITAIFNNNFQGIGNDYELSSSAPAVLCRTSDVLNIKQDDALQLNNKNYTVRDTEADGTGYTRIILKR